LLGVLLLGGDDSKGTPPRPSGPVRWQDATAYDPDGDQTEHDAEAPNAIDGDPVTYWTTERYQSFDKEGVGLILRARRAVSPKTLTFTTDTPGFTAEIQSGNSPSGPFGRASGPRTAGPTTGYSLNRGGRYFVIWITDLGDNESVHINEVRAR
jgi:hypothetical protein